MIIILISTWVAYDMSGASVKDSQGQVARACAWSWQGRATTPCAWAWQGQALSLHFWPCCPCNVVIPLAGIRTALKVSTIIVSLCPGA